MFLLMIQINSLVLWSDIELKLLICLKSLNKQIRLSQYEVEHVYCKPQFLMHSKTLDTSIIFAGNEVEVLLKVQVLALKSVIHDSTTSRSVSSVEQVLWSHFPSNTLGRVAAPP